MTIRRFLLLAGAIGFVLIAWMYRTALADPVVRHARIALLPREGKSQEIRALLISDIHVAGPDMPPSRLDRIVDQINRLRPDVVLMAGDFVSDKAVSTHKYSLDEAVAPLRRLRSTFGSYAVLGNHDHWRDAADARRALNQAGVKLLDNDAARAGPLVIGGLDDAYTGQDDVGATVRAMDRLGGVPILLSHSPDPFPRTPPAIRLMVAGHTHCGQIRLPLIGAIATMSDHGDRYACGVITEHGRTLIVGAGLGTSLLPLRLGAVPDMWMITIVRRP